MARVVRVRYARGTQKNSNLKEKKSESKKASTHQTQKVSEWSTGPVEKARKFFHNTHVQLSNIFK